MFSSGANIDLKRLEEEIRKDIEEKAKRLFTEEDLDELQNLELGLLPNPDRVRPFFHKELEFEQLQLQFDFEEPELKSCEKQLKYYEGDYNISLDTFLFSSRSLSGTILQKLRQWLRPFFRLHGNIDAVIHKQAMFNREQVEFNNTTVRTIASTYSRVTTSMGTLLSSLGRSLERPFHYIRVLHTVNNYLVTELTKLHLQHQALKNQVDALAYDLEQLRKRERLLEKTAVLKSE